MKTLLIPLKYRLLIVFVISFLFLFLSSAPSWCQSEFVDNLGLGLVDNRIDSLFGPTQRKRTEFSLLEAKPVEERPFWIRPNISAQYDYSLKHMKADGSEINQHSGTCSLFVDSKIGWSINPSFKGAFADTSIPAGGSATLRSIGPSFSTGLELLHLAHGDYSPQAPVQLVLGASVGYSDSDKDTLSAASSLTSAQTGTWQYGGVLSFSDQLITNYKTYDKTNFFGGLFLAISPTLQFLESRAKNQPIGTVVDTGSSTFVLDSQLRYLMTPDLTFQVFGRWYRDVNQKVAPGKSRHYQNWGEFGAQLTVNLGEGFKLKAGYSYEAFNDLYYNHKVLANLTYNF